MNLASARTNLALRTAARSSPEGERLKLQLQARQAALKERGGVSPRPFLNFHAPQLYSTLSSCLASLAIHQPLFVHSIPLSKGMTK